MRNREPRPKRLLKLLRPTVEVELRPLGPPGGVGEVAPSERPPMDPMVEERPRSPMRKGPLGFAVVLVLVCERTERSDLVESLRKSEPDEARFGVVASAPCDACEPELAPPVEAPGVVGAMSGKDGEGSIFMGRGNSDARCLRRPNPKRVEP